MRVPAIEANILALGSKTYVGGEEDDLRVNLSTAVEFRNQVKALSNITLYEQRLTRQFERTLAQLQALQSERRKDQQTQPVATTNGFVFSTNTTVEPSTCSAVGSPDPAPPLRPDASMSNQAGADWIMERIADLLPERYRGIYGREDAAVTAAVP